jgi:hypothetical protein
MDPVKIAGIKNWPIPTKVKDVRSFLGFCNFYRPFIRGFAHLARPLNELTRKDTEWSWETRHQDVFDELKTRVTTEPVLAHPILTDPFKLEVDAPGFAMGAVLLQKKVDGKKHPIAYYSKTLSTAEQNYDVYDLELLAIVNALDHWRPYLAGSPHKIIIHSDHQNLLYWKEHHCTPRTSIYKSNGSTPEPTKTRQKYTKAMDRPAPAQTTSRHLVQRWLHGNHRRHLGQM